MKTRNLIAIGILIFIAIGFFNSISQHFNPKGAKLAGIIFLAFGQNSNKDDAWLGLYEDSTWEFGKSYTEINTKGTYALKGDTIILTSSVTEDHLEESILLANSQKTKSPDSKLDGLRIEMNRLNER